MKPLLKPSSHSNLYQATMRSPSFRLPSRNQITRLDLRERFGIKKRTKIQRFWMQACLVSPGPRESNPALACHTRPHLWFFPCQCFALVRKPLPESWGHKSYETKPGIWPISTMFPSIPGFIWYDIFLMWSQTTLKQSYDLRCPWAETSKGSVFKKDIQVLYIDRLPDLLVP